MKENFHTKISQEALTCKLKTNHTFSLSFGALGFLQVDQLSYLLLILSSHTLEKTKCLSLIEIFITTSLIKRSDYSHAVPFKMY